MNWINFQFCCRYIYQKLSEGEDITIAQNSLIKNYPRYNPAQLLQTQIYKLIYNSSEPQELLLIYGNIKLDVSNDALTKLHNIKTYLFIIFTVFVLLSIVCNFFVIPVFQDIFHSMEAPSNIPLKQFSYIWLVSFILLLVSGLIVILFSNKINNFYRSTTPFKTSFLANLLITKTVINKIQQIDALIYAPLNQNINKYSQYENEFTKRLKLDNLNIAIELEALINSQYKLLSKLINSRLATLLFIVSFLVVIAILNFVYSLYSPLFAIGTTI